MSDIIVSVTCREQVNTAHPGDGNVSAYASEMNTIAKPKEGSLSAKDLGIKCYFQNLSLEVYDEEKGIFRDVLYKVSGRLPKGRVLAVVGSSAEEANALLKVLGGRVGCTPWERTQGIFSLGSQVCDLAKPNDLALRTAYVQDSSPLCETQTPAEAFHFYARLRIHRGTFPSKSAAIANKTLKDLGLNDVRDKQCRKVNENGLSIKERLLMRMGMQLMAEKVDLIVLEDVISSREDGLDEDTAYEIIHKARELAREPNGGPSVILSLSSIPQKILPLLDRLLVISNGQVIYHGVPRQLIEHLSDNGFPIPKFYDPLEHFLMIADGELDTSKGMKLLIERDRARINANDDDFSDDEEPAVLEPYVLLREIWKRRKVVIEETKVLKKKYKNAFPSTSVPYSEPIYRVIRANACLQFMFLFRRDFKAMFRRFSSNLHEYFFACLIISLVYFDLDWFQEDLVDRPSCIFSIISFLVVRRAVTTASKFPAQHRLYEFERVRSNVYNTKIFLLSNFLTQCLEICVVVLVFCGIAKIACNLHCDYFLLTMVCLVCSLTFCGIAMIVGMYVHDESVSGQTMLAIFVPCLVLSDFFVLSWNTPYFISWIYWVNPLFYAFNLLRVGEISGQTFSCEDSDICLSTSGNNYLVGLGVNPDPFDYYVGIFALCGIVRLVIMPIILWFRLREYGVKVT
jgi:ABC-type multidrug transport system ATPase subunit